MSDLTVGRLLAAAGALMSGGVAAFMFTEGFPVYGVTCVVACVLSIINYAKQWP